MDAVMLGLVGASAQAVFGLVKYFKNSVVSGESFDFAKYGVSLVFGCVVGAAAGLLGIVDPQTLNDALLQLGGTNVIIANVLDAATMQKKI
jgi:hypothetical protein